MPWVLAKPGRSANDQKRSCPRSREREENGSHPSLQSRSGLAARLFGQLIWEFARCRGTARTSVRTITGRSRGVGLFDVCGPDGRAFQPFPSGRCATISRRDLLGGLPVGSLASAGVLWAVGSFRCRGHHRYPFSRHRRSKQSARAIGFTIEATPISDRPLPTVDRRLPGRPAAAPDSGRSTSRRECCPARTNRTVRCRHFFTLPG